MKEIEPYVQLENISNNACEPRLEAPGAGLPKIESVLFKYMVAPVFAAIIPWRPAIRIFQSEGYKILALTESASHEMLAKRVLIPRLIAMEDSSRFWSVHMTLRHLILVGETIEDIIINSGHGQHSSKILSIVAVKPGLDTPATVLDDFRKFLPRFAQNITLLGDHHHSRVTHVHPWLGSLTMHQWLCLAGIHQRLHRRQIQMILGKQSRS
jgi:hypothetical protein